jgi:formylglycine-generating enzyme required for sulfatase activity
MSRQRSRAGTFWTAATIILPAIVGAVFTNPVAAQVTVGENCFLDYQSGTNLEGGGYPRPPNSGNALADAAYEAARANHCEQAFLDGMRASRPARSLVSPPVPAPLSPTFPAVALPPVCKEKGVAFYPTGDLNRMQFLLQIVYGRYLQYSQVSDDINLSITKKESECYKAWLDYLRMSTSAGQPLSLVKTVLPANHKVALLSATEERVLKPKDIFKECDACPEMIVVPAGMFVMGSPESEAEREIWEGPQHRVTIPKPFAVSPFAITGEQFEAFVKATDRVLPDNCRTAPDPPQYGPLPSVCVSWNDAKAYVEWLAMTTGKPYRLLSEAEREYVARAGTTTPFWWGSSISTDQANYDGNRTYGGPKGKDRHTTLPVGTFAPNAWELYQVHGNVWEWVEDCWNLSYDGAPADDRPWTQGDCNYRALRGGSWGNGPNDLRAAARSGFTVDSREWGFGFRVARTLRR